MISGCLAKLQQAEAEWAAVMHPSVLVLVVLLAGGAVAALWAPWLLRSYGRTVTRYMSFRQVAAPPQAWWQRRTRLLHRPEAASATREPGGGTLADAMQRRESRIRRATALAFAVFVVIGAAVFMLHERVSALDYANMLFPLIVLAAGPAVVNVMPAGSARRLLGISAALLLVSAAIEGAVGASEWSDAVVGALFVLALQVVCLHRLLRALFVPLTVLAGAAAFGIVAATAALLPAGCISDPAHLAGADAWLGIGSVAGAVFAFGLCLWGGVQLLSGLARLYERGFISDLSLVSGSGVLIVAGLVAFSADKPGTTPTVLGLVWLAWCSATLATYIVVLRMGPSPAMSKSLLVLRVFSKGSKAEQLLDVVQTRWRYAGPVLQIGGPDLAQLNIDPYELVKFVSFKTHELFLPGEVSREQLQDGLDLAPDREGRFRVNDVFCFDTAWRSTVESLMDMSDAILLDLRGFQAKRAGTAYEITRLAAHERLRRVVAIGDKLTDWAHVDTLLDAEGQRDGPRETRLHADAADLARLCIASLCAVALQSEPARSGLR